MRLQTTLLACLLAVTAYGQPKVIGNNPNDTFLPEFFRQNSNSDTLMGGINSNSTTKLSVSLLPAELPSIIATNVTTNVQSALRGITNLSTKGSWTWYPGNYDRHFITVYLPSNPSISGVYSNTTDEQVSLYSYWSSDIASRPYHVALTVSNQVGLFLNGDTNPVIVCGTNDFPSGLNAAFKPIGSGLPAILQGDVYAAGKLFVGTDSVSTVSQLTSLDSNTTARVLSASNLMTSVIASNSSYNAAVIAAGSNVMTATIASNAVTNATSILALSNSVLNSLTVTNTLVGAIDSNRIAATTLTIFASNSLISRLTATNAALVTAIASVTTNGSSQLILASNVLAGQLSGATNSLSSRLSDSITSSGSSISNLIASTSNSISSRLTSTNASLVSALTTVSNVTLQRLSQTNSALVDYVTSISNTLAYRTFSTGTGLTNAVAVTSNGVVARYSADILTATNAAVQAANSFSTRVSNSLAASKVSNAGGTATNITLYGTALKATSGNALTWDCGSGVSGSISSAGAMTVVGSNTSVQVAPSGVSIVTGGADRVKLFTNGNAMLAGEVTLTATNPIRVIQNAANGRVLTSDTSGHVTLQDNNITMTDSNLLLCVASDGFQPMSLQRDLNGITTNAVVVWPDGTLGTFTATTVNSAWRTVDGFTVSYTNRGRLIVQGLVLRNPQGSVVIKPALTITNLGAYVPPVPPSGSIVIPGPIMNYVAYPAEVDGYTSVGLTHIYDNSIGQFIVAGNDGWNYAVSAVVIDGFASLKLTQTATFVNGILLDSYTSSVIIVDGYPSLYFQ